MYTVTNEKQQYDIYELKDTTTNSWFRICPERGGIVTSYGVNGKELLYLDKETFLNPFANVRGGIPVLFPICGQLTNGQYLLDGHTYQMKNHGVARLYSWIVDSTDTFDHAAITLKLISNPQTLAIYPFHFELTFRYVLLDGNLTIYQSYKNCSPNPMPIYSGFHPYFKAMGKRIMYNTDASRYLDCNDGLEKPFYGEIDLTHMTESAILLNTHEKTVSFTIQEENRVVSLEYGKEFKYIVLWSVKDKSFVCVEPWMAMPDALNSGIDLQYVQPDVTLDTYLRLHVTDI